MFPTLRSRIAAALYAVLLVAFWRAAQYFKVSQRIHGHLASSFVGFALAFLPFWAFGFGADDWLRRHLRTRAARIAAPALIAVPYLFFAIPHGVWALRYTVVFAGLPALLAWLNEGLPPLVSWRDAITLPLLALPVMLNWWGNAFPYPGLSGFAKLLIGDAGLYAYLVARALPGVGYKLGPRPRDLAVGVLAWAGFAPIGIVVGLGLHFIRPHGGWPGAGHLAGAALVTFFFVALPEELFFRGLLQNLLETRWGRRRALFTAAVLFGLAHLHHAPVPNWRYAILAAVAGTFYGLAWRDRRRLFCSATAHTLVDVLWGAWFR